MEPETRMRFFLPVIMFFLSSLCYSQIISQQPAKPDDKDPIRKNVAALEETLFVTRAVLKNGMKVLINENRAHPVVSIQVFVKAGILYEPPDSPGLASLLTSMVYRSIPDKSAGTSWQNARLLGGSLDSSTGYTEACFEIAAPANRWKKALQVQSEAVLNSEFERDVLKKEARILQYEAGEYLENPSIYSNESLLELGFGSNRLGKWSTVLEDDPVAIPFEKMVEFHRRAYVPGRMMIVVSGDVSAIEVLSEVARLYGDVKAAGKTDTPVPVQNTQRDFRYRGIKGGLSIPHLLFGFHVPAADSSDYEVLEVLSAILGSGNGSILSARLRDQKKLIFEGEANLSPHPGFGYLTLHLETAPENIDRCEIAVFTELELLKRKEPDSAEMERAWAQLERFYRKQVETVSGRARLLAQFEYLGDWQQIDRHMADLRKVKPSDIRRVAQKYLRMENCSLLEYVPSSVDLKNRTAETVRATLEGLLSPSANEEQNLRDRETVPAFDIPEKTDDYKFSWAQYPFETASVLRGPEIFIREDHTSPLVHVGLFFPGGRLAESEQNSGITDLLVRMMLQGSAEENNNRVHRQLEIYGGQLESIVTDDYFGFYFSIPSKNFHPGFQLLVDALKSPSFDEEIVAWQKELLAAERVQFRDSPARADDIIRQKLFHGLPYFRNLYVGSSDAAEITSETLKEWYDLNIRDRKPVVIMIGDSEGTSLAAYFVRHFSGSRFRETELPGDYAEPVENNISIEEKWDRGHSLVAMGFQAPPEGDVDQYAAAVIQCYLGRSGRMYHEIQQKKEGIHNLKLSYEPRLRGGSFIAYAGVTPGNEDAVLDALDREFQHTVNGPYSYREFRSAVNTAAGNFQIRQQTPILQITDVARKILAGEGIEGYRSLQAKLLAVTEEDLQSAAERIFMMENAVRLRIFSKEPFNPDVLKAE